MRNFILAGLVFIVVVLASNSLFVIKETEKAVW